MEALFHGYCIDGLDIGDLETLVSIAQHSNLDGADTRRFLQSHDGEVAVREEQGRGHRLGIRAVPHFVLNERLAISGVQPVEALRAAIEQITNESGITQG